MHSIWSQCIKIRAKQQQKICKQLESEQHIAQWSMGHWWNKRGNLKVMEVNEKENMTYQNLWDTAKAVQKESL
jgi:hypothetical protein